MTTGWRLRTAKSTFLPLDEHERSEGHGDRHRQQGPHGRPTWDPRPDGDPQDGAQKAYGKASEHDQSDASEDGD